MIARAEMSTNAQSQAEKSSPKGMSIALIGPNDTHRQVVARALSASQGRKVHEFIDYPDNLNDLSSMLDQKFDFVLVDVDTDESYALQIIAKLSDIGQPVMAYSARTDQELLMSCMRAGARDFLPLPTEDQPPQAQSAPAEIHQAKPVAVAPQAPQSQVESRSVSVPPAPTVRTHVTPIVPDKRIAPASEPWPARVPEAKVAAVKETAVPENFAAEKPMADFAEWDAANLRHAPLPVPTKRTEARPRPSLVPERKRTEPTSHTSALDTPAVPIERPPVSVDLFRSSSVQSKSEPDEAAEKQGANWVKWILIAAGPLVLALVLLVVFTRPSSQKPAAAPVREASVPVQDESPSQPVVTPETKPAAKPQAGSPVAKIAAPSAIPTPVTTDPAPVSSDDMAAQLQAPTRIAGQIKKTAPVEEPPPSAPAPVGLGDNSTVPGAVFGSLGKAKATPHVVTISAGVADGMILHKTPPVYPKFAQEAHITGKVMLRATITKQGTIEGVQVISGPKILAPAAVEAVKTWKYRPYSLDNQPVSVETNITVVFGDGRS